MASSLMNINIYMQLLISGSSNLIPSRENDSGIQRIRQTTEVWGFHGGDYEERRLLGCYAAWIL
jgi:hypothetical protein